MQACLPYCCSIPPRPADYMPLPGPKEEFKYKWMHPDGSIHDEEIIPGGMLEIAATQLITAEYFEYVSVIGEIDHSFISEVNKYHGGQNHQSVIVEY